MVNITIKANELELIMEFIMQNMGTIIVSIILSVAVILSVRTIIKNRKEGKCSGGCTYCPGASNCHSDKKKV